MVTGVFFQRACSLRTRVRVCGGWAAWRWRKASTYGTTPGRGSQTRCGISNSLTTLAMARIKPSWRSISAGEPNQRGWTTTLETPGIIISVNSAEASTKYEAVVFKIGRAFAGKFVANPNRENYDLFSSNIYLLDRNWESTLPLGARILVFSCSKRNKGMLF